MKRFRVLILIALVLVFAYLYFNHYIKKLAMPIDINSNEYISVVIPSGSTTGDIAEILEKNGLIRSHFVFKYLSRKNHYDGKYQAGTYMFGFSMSMEDIMSSIKRGKAEKNTVRFTIPEGYDLKRIANTLEEQGLIDQKVFFDVIENEDFTYKFLENIPKGKNRLEGFLFPDTYEIYKGSSEKEIINKMLARFNELFIDDYYRRVEELGYSIKEIVTLASIIERETLLDKERPIVSSVFHNRLKINMLLQSCATVQYILGEVKPKLSTTDTQKKSPYNTYLNKGLPPGPIASPGLSSIKAALYPENTKYKYFVAKGDGSHAFAVTYNEFLRYKNKYIR